MYHLLLGEYIYRGTVSTHPERIDYLVIDSGSTDPVFYWKPLLQIEDLLCLASYC